MTTITEKISSIKLMEKRIEELKSEKRGNISEIKDSFTSRFERIYPMADINIIVGSSDVKFFYKGNDIFSLDVVRDDVIRTNTYMTMNGYDKEKSVFELERFVLMGRIADITRTQYKEVARLINELENSIYKSISSIDNEISKIKNFIKDEEEKIFEFKMDWVIDFYKSEKDLKFIPSSDRYIQIGRYTNRFDSIEITNVTKSKKTWNLRLYNGEIFNVVGLYTRNKDFKETIQTLFDFSLEYNNNNNN